MSDIGQKAKKAVGEWRPNFVFGRLPESDKDVYRMLHSVHCEEKKANNPDHVCEGTISIRADSITLRCPRCGNVRTEL